MRPRSDSLTAAFRASYDSINDKMTNDAKSFRPLPMAMTQNWTVRLFRCAPFGQSTWRLLDRYGKEVKDIDIGKKSFQSGTASAKRS